MKWIVRVMVALLAFLVGVSSSQLLRQGRVSQTTSVPNVKVLDQPAISPPAETWRRIVVKGRFSFYIPSYLNHEEHSDLNHDGHSDNKRTAVGTFCKGNWDMNGLFYLYYYSHSDTEGDPTDRPNRYRSTTRSEVRIGGKRATMVTEIPSADEYTCIHDTPTVEVYFPNIGKGRKLFMRLASDEQGIEVAKRVIESIEFLR